MQKKYLRFSFTIKGYNFEKQENKYLIVEDDFPWETGKMFNHRYGDGIDSCVIKGINAIIDK